MHVVGLSGQAADVDPGRPKVPSFGRRLYHLKAFRGSNRRPGSPATELLAIGRKTGLNAERLQTHVRLLEWRTAYRRFRRRLAEARFTGIVFDYDGTLCGPEDRNRAVRGDVALELTRLLDAGIAIGVASGRGRSVRTALRAAIPQPHWSRVVVGYYNGAYLHPLSESLPPDAAEPPDGALASLAAEIKASRLLGPPATIDVRRPQLTVTAPNAGATDEVWQALQELLHRHATSETSVVRSGHSVDILAAGVDKRTLIGHVAAVALAEGATLCIGDRGAYPGNDHLLLSERWSLSVDEVSRDPNSCWNLAPAATRWADACLAYMRRLRPSGRYVRFV